MSTSQYLSVIGIIYLAPHLGKGAGIFLGLISLLFSTMISIAEIVK